MPDDNPDMTSLLAEARLRCPPLTTDLPWLRCNLGSLLDALEAALVDTSDLRTAIEVARRAAERRGAALAAASAEIERLRILLESIIDTHVDYTGLPGDSPRDAP